MAALCRKCLSFFKKEVVLCVAALLAAASCFLSPPSAAYLTYIDWNTLALLFGLMAVMQGLQKANFFVYLASLLLRRIRSTRTLVFLLGEGRELLHPLITLMVAAYLFAGSLAWYRHKLGG